MPTTSTYSLRYPASTDDVRPYEDIQFLANDVESALTGGRVSGARIATGTVAAGSADSASITTTETSIASVTASLVSGLTYRIRYVTRIGASVANDVALVRIREDSVAGTELIGDNFLMFTTGSAGQPAVMEGEYTASATGSKTFHLTLVRGGGSGNLRRESTFMPTYIYVDYIRG